MILGRVRSQIKTDQLFQTWTALYAISLILCPHIVIQGKLIYAAEWMLIFPLLLVAREWFRSQWIRPSKALVALWIGLAIVFFSGIFRGNFAFQISLYKDLNNIVNERFSWGQDGIRWVRWTLLFSLPWLFSQIQVPHPSQTKDRFLESLKYAVMVSASLAIAEHLGFINLGPVFHQARAASWWQDRSYGTFTGPLEASLVYGLQIVLIATQPRSSSHRRSIINLLAATLSLIALYLTFGFSSFVALVITLASLIFGNASKPIRIIWASILMAAAVTTFHYVPTEVLLWKLNSVYLRTWTWTSWINLIPSHPWLLFSGIGFSNLNVDNSCLMVLISGGLVWFVPLYLWMKQVLQKPSSEIQFGFLFWVISWLTLDSIGYWGIGRIMWMLMSIHQIKAAAPMAQQSHPVAFSESLRCLTQAEEAAKVAASKKEEALTDVYA